MPYLIKVIFMSDTLVIQAKGDHIEQIERGIEKLLDDYKAKVVIDGKEVKLTMQCKKVTIESY